MKENLSQTPTPKADRMGKSIITTYLYIEFIRVNQQTTTTRNAEKKNLGQI